MAVLLLPDRLERFAHRAQAQELLRAPAVVAIEPGLMPFSFVVRAPERTLRRTSARQARRLVRRLPGRPVAVAVFDPMQWPLARALAERVERCEVWVAAAEDAPPAGPDPEGDADTPLRARLATLRAEALEAAALTFAPDATEPVWDRLGALGVAVTPS